MHPMFIHQTNGMIVVSNGSATATFDTVAAFQESEPAYALPAGVVALNYESRGAGLIHVHTLADGSVSTQTETNADYELYMSKVGDYLLDIAERAHPLHGITDDATARLVAKQQVSVEAEGRMAAITAMYAPTEQKTWERQYEEALAVTADPAALTPFLDVIVRPGETTADVAASVLANADALKMAAAPYVRVRRILHQQIDGLNAAALHTFVTNIQTEWDTAAALP